MLSEFGARTRWVCVHRTFTLRAAYVDASRIASWFCMSVSGKAARLCPACLRRPVGLLAHMDFADEDLS